MSVSDAPTEIPGEVTERVDALCRALPEVTTRTDESQVRSRPTAYSYDIRRRSFCLLVAKRGPSGKPAPFLVVRADPEDREALLSMGHPYFAPRASPGRIGVLITKETDWEEIREVITESYRVLAPKKLIARLD